MQATNWLKAAPKGRIWSKNNGITSGKMTHKTLFQILVELMVLNIVFFNRIVNEWSGLPSHIRESNSIATFKKNVLSFIKDY